jgi:POT family proton-dependent oligopeptide transporter
MTSDSATVAAQQSDKTFFGQPRGLAYLAFTEAWERFSFYGMQALLVLYLTQQLLLPGHIENVAGFTGFRAAVEAVFGPMTTLALASQIVGLYAGFVYFTPVFGGLIADRFIGRRNAVALGALLMSAGHFAMAFEQAFLLAILLLVIGCGFLKGNISAQVGGLYAEHDGAGRTRGFAIFSIAINVGAVAGPLLCGLLAQLYGWHFGFGLAGVFMLAGLITYLVGYRTLTEQTAQAATVQTTEESAPQQAQWRIIAALLLVMALTIFHSVAYYQIYNIALIWIDAQVDLNLFGFMVPAAWFNSLDSFISIAAVPLLFALWRWQKSHGGEPGEVSKMAIGAALCCAANLLLMIAALTGERASVLFPLGYGVLLGVAFLYYWPTLLALVSQAAPANIKSTMMGVVFLTLFVGNIILGRLGAFYEPLGPVAFWALHAAIAATGAVLLALAARPLQRILNI